MKLNFTLEGNPIAKARPRFKRIGNKVITYDPQKKESLKAKLHLKQQMALQGVLRPLESKVIVKMTFHTKIPKSWSQRRLKQEGVYNAKKPDLDNMAKAVMDFMNEIVYIDDNRVVELECRKVYSHNPCTEIEVSEVEFEKVIPLQVLQVRDRL